METPRCPYFGTCGGCAQQNVEYSTQVEQKKQRVMNYFKARGITLPDVSVHFDSAYEYRNRMDFVFTKNGLGLREKGEWKKLLHVAQCPISNAKLNVLLKEVNEWFSTVKPDVFDVRSTTGTFRYAVIRAPEHTDDSAITFVLNRDSPILEEQKKLVLEFAKKTSAKNVLIGTVISKTDMSVSDDAVAVKGNTHVTEKLLGKTMTYHSQAFFQNNPIMAEQMIAHVKKEIGNGKTLIDLYGGAGTFGVSLAELFEKTIIIDNVLGNIEQAKENIAHNNVNAEARCADANVLSEYAGEITLLVDPPRVGLHPKVVSAIKQLRPKTLAYISCNPEQLAKEVTALGYDLKTLAVFDLFPQTEHVEAIATLTPKHL